MRTLYEASIWAPGTIPVEEWKYRNLKRVMFPAVDVLLILGGFSAARYGIPAISEFYPDLFVDIFAYVMSFCALVALVGVSFPRLWAVEIAGKAAVFGLIVGYITSLFILTLEDKGDSDSRGFVLIIAMIAVCPIVWRLSLLGSEWQARVLARKAAARNAKAELGE